MRVSGVIDLFNGRSATKHTHSYIHIYTHTHVDIDDNRHNIKYYMCCVFFWYLYKEML